MSNEKKKKGGERRRREKKKEKKWGGVGWRVKLLKKSKYRNKVLKMKEK